MKKRKSIYVALITSHEKSLIFILTDGQDCNVDRLLFLIGKDILSIKLCFCHSMNKGYNKTITIAIMIVTAAVPSFATTTTTTTNMLSSSNDETYETIAIMRRQEETIYRKRENVYSSCNNNSTDEVDDECRQKMVEWCCQIINFCQMNYNTVEITMNIVDRYVCTEHGQRHALNDRAQYQLVCMAALYTSIKTNESRVINSELLATLSQSMYSKQQIEDMEYTILSSLQWYVNPPTSLGFVQQYINAIPNTIVDDYTKESILQSCTVQLAEFVKHPLLATTPASTVAYVTLMNSLESMPIISNNKVLVSQIRTMIEQYISLSFDAATNSTTVLRNELSTIFDVHVIKPTINGRKISYQSIAELNSC